MLTLIQYPRDIVTVFIKTPIQSLIKREIKEDSIAIFWTIYINLQTARHQVRTPLA